MNDRSEQGIIMAAAHILMLLDNVQEQLAAIRRAAEQIVHQQEASDAQPQ